MMNMPAHPFFPADTLNRANDLEPRLRSAIQQAATSCECREHVDQAIARFMSLEQARQDRRSLLAARQQLARIVGLTHMLTELDDLSWNEADRSAFREIAQLFADVAEAAALGSAAVRMLSRR